MPYKATARSAANKLLLAVSPAPAVGRLVWDAELGRAVEQDGSFAGAGQRRLTGLPP